jgi:L,D-transpeptidase ErfK/SrfK
LPARHPSANVTQALAAALSLSLSAPVVRGQVGGQTPIFVIHGTPKTCGAITQLDSALSSDYQPFFAGWIEKDYADAVAWSEACSEYGWHVPGHPRIARLHAQHDRMLGPSQTQRMSSAATAVALPSARVRADVAAQPQIALSATHELPPDGAVVIGTDIAITSHYEDTLPDIARRYRLGYEEIARANPGVDMWLPGEGTRILLPGRHILPPGSREGVVVNLAEHRLYYFPKPNKNEKPVVITYPVSIGKMGQNTPLGQSYITAKVKYPSWYPPASVRKEHAERGDPLPAVVGPGPDNPLGDFMMRLGFGDGTYEIHGTNKPVTVGMASTNGCIGMYPEDVAALFALVPVGTLVHLINVPVKVAWSGDALLLEAHPPVDAQGQNSELNIDRFSDLLRATVHDTTIAILWDHARQALRKADGVIATVGVNPHGQLVPGPDGGAAHAPVKVRSVPDAKSRS